MADIPRDDEPRTHEAEWEFEGGYPILLDDFIGEFDDPADDEEPDA